MDRSSASRSRVDCSGASRRRVDCSSASRCRFDSSGACRRRVDSNGDCRRRFASPIVRDGPTRQHGTVMSCVHTFADSCWSSCCRQHAWSVVANVPHASMVHAVRAVYCVVHYVAMHRSLDEGRKTSRDYQQWNNNERERHHVPGMKYAVKKNGYVPSYYWAEGIARTAHSRMRTASWQHGTAYRPRSRAAMHASNARSRPITLAPSLTSACAARAALAFSDTGFVGRSPDFWCVFGPGT